MVIAFGRLEPIQRTHGGNVCRKAAYMSRERLHFEGSTVLEPRIFDFSRLNEDLEYHTVLLPEGTNEKFKEIEYLWNYATGKEQRCDSQEGFEFLLALPKEPIVTREDRIEIAEAFAKKHFVAERLIAQVDLHFDEENPHAHFLITQRCVTEDGEALEDKKARHLNLKYKTTSWSFLARQHLDTYFEEKGIDLRCDPDGIVAQVHLGAKRHWGTSFDLVLENAERMQLNSELAKDPAQILKVLSDRQSVFTKEDVEAFIDKHTPKEAINEVKNLFWKQKAITQLRDKKTGEKVDCFSTWEVIEEENALKSLAERLSRQKARPMTGPAPAEFSNEQKKAYYHLLQGKGLMLLQGYAGTGKSLALKAIADAYRKNGITVRTLGADSGAAYALNEKGLAGSENIHQFLYANKYQQSAQKKELWILDEAGKLGNLAMLEFFKAAVRQKAMVILSGDDAQLPPVARGCFFSFACTLFQKATLEDIKRQRDLAAAQITLSLAKGKTDHALEELAARDQIHWADTKWQAMERLIRKWVIDHQWQSPIEEKIILAGTHDETRVLNDMIHQVRQKWGDVSRIQEIKADTEYGTIYIGKGDLLIFRENNKDMGIYNGTRGTVQKVEQDRLTIDVKRNAKRTDLVELKPKSYRKFQLGYAINTTVCQGGDWENVYFLPGSHLSRQVLYVGGSRHIKRVDLFFARTEVSGMAAAKRQARRSNEKPHSLLFLNDKQIAAKLRHQETQTLLASDKITDTIKGYTRIAVDFIQSKTQGQGRLKDSDRFYSYRKETPTHPLKQVAFNGDQTLDSLAVASDQKLYLPEKILKNINLDVFFKRFLVAKEEVAKAFDLAEKEAKEKNAAIDKTAAFEKLSMQIIFARIFFEKCHFDQLSIRNAFGPDVEKTVVENAAAFHPNFDSLSIDTHAESNLFDLWKDAYSASRIALRQMRLESVALGIKEENHRSQPKVRSLSFTANWVAFGYVLKHGAIANEDKQFVLSDPAKSPLSEQAAAAIDRGAVSFQNSLKAIELFRDQKAPENFCQLGGRYQDVLKDIASLREKIAIEIGDKRRLPEDCPSYKGLFPLFIERSTLAACLFEVAARLDLKKEEVFTKKALSFLNYQAEKFEERFLPVSPLKEGVKLPEIQPLVNAHLKAQQESLRLERALEMERAIQNKSKKEIHGFKEWKEAYEKQKAVSFALYEKVQELGKNPKKTLTKNIYKEATSYEISESIRRKENEQKQQALSALSERKRQLVDDYERKSSRAKELFTTWKEETEGDDEKGYQTKQKDFFSSCNIRNKAAFNMKSGLTEAELSTVFSPKKCVSISAQAIKEEQREKRQQDREIKRREEVKEIDNDLKKNWERLVFSLMNEEPHSMNSKGWRFGSSGSLFVSCDGWFKSFEDDSKGGSFRFIQYRLGCDFKEALDYAKQFLNRTPDLAVSKAFSTQAAKEDWWVSLKPDPSCPAPKTGMVKLPKKMDPSEWKEVMRHPYRDENGHLLFYVLRLQSMKDPTKKQTLPLSYGHPKDNPTWQHWRFKGYDTGSHQKLPYNVHLLKQKPTAPVIICEGEKAADLGKKHFPDQDFVYLTWIGGASSVEKTDWSLLAGRKVIVCPDNDEPGFLAAKKLCTHLQLKEANEVYLGFTKEKMEGWKKGWDIADDLPKAAHVADLFSHRQDELKDEVLKGFTSLERKKAFLIVTSFWGRTEEEKTQEIEKARWGMDQLAVKAAWKEEAQDLLQKQSVYRGKVESDPLINASSNLAERLSYQMVLFEAIHGNEPPLNQTIEMKKTIDACATSKVFLDVDKKWQVDVAIDRVLMPICEKALKGYFIGDREKAAFEQGVETEARLLERQQQAMECYEKVLEKEEQRQMDRGISY